MVAFALTAAAIVVVMATWLHYLATIPRETVPERPIVHAALMVLSIAMANIALVVATPQLWQIAAAVVVIMLAFLFLWLLSIAKLPDSELVVSVGDALPEFAATTHEGEPFSSDAFAGNRVLFKFFRGHW